MRGCTSNPGTMGSLGICITCSNIKRVPAEPSCPKWRLRASARSFLSSCFAPLLLSSSHLFTHRILRYRGPQEHISFFLPCTDLYHLFGHSYFLLSLSFSLVLSSLSFEIMSWIVASSKGLSRAEVFKGLKTLSVWKSIWEPAGY